MSADLPEAFRGLFAGLVEQRYSAVSWPITGYVDIVGSLEEFGAARVVATARGRFFPCATAGITPGSGTS